jgi:hypothetical protein
MKKFEFYKIGFEHIKETIYVAIEELHFEYNFALNGYCLFKNSKGEEFEKIVTFKQPIGEGGIGEMQIKHLKEDIKYTATAEFVKKYGEGFDRKTHKPSFIYLDDINQFNPYGFKDSTYDDICETIISVELRERFQKMKGTYNEDKSGSLIN